MVNFCDIRKCFNMVFALLLIIVVLPSCFDEPETIETKVLAYQAVIDSLVEEVILPVKNEIDNQILVNHTTNKDTFELARKKIPITKIQFLISHEYYVLGATLKEYQNHNVTKEVVTQQLKTSQFTVDSLITYEFNNFME